MAVARCWMAMVGLVLGSGIGASAAPDEVVLSAAYDATSKTITITITGSPAFRNLPAVVTFDGVATTVPAPISGKISLALSSTPAPGSYRLTVKQGPFHWAPLDLAIADTSVGPAGPKGDPGVAGPAGPKGDAGATGPRGATGPQGPAGTPGAMGLPGPVGSTGPAGVAGPIGATGATGANGPAGVAGPIGATGPAGVAGPIGATGPKGDVGAAGPQGPQGVAGVAGPAGAPGPQGVQGPKGDTGATGPAGPGGSGQDGPNPKQIALSRWYEIGTAAIFDMTSPGRVGAFAPQASALTYDGSNIYMLATSGEIYRIRSGDGARVDLIGSPVYYGLARTVSGAGVPGAMVYDGASLWLLFPGSNSIRNFRLGATDLERSLFQSDESTEEGTFTVGATPVGIVFDGAAIWTTNSADNTVSRLKLNPNFVGPGFGLTGYLAISVGTTPEGIAFDGANVWVLNCGDNTVTKIHASDGAVLGTYATGGVNAAGTPMPQTLTVDGENLWIANAGSGTVTKMQVADGTVLGIYATGANPSAVAFDGRAVWVIHLNGLVVKLRASDGATLASVKFSTSNLRGLVFDGTNMWVGDPNNHALRKM